VPFGVEKCPNCDQRIDVDDDSGGHLEDMEEAERAVPERLESPASSLSPARGEKGRLISLADIKPAKPQAAAAPAAPPAAPPAPPAAPPAPTGPPAPGRPLTTIVKHLRAGPEELLDMKKKGVRLFGTNGLSQHGKTTFLRALIRTVATEIGTSNIDIEREVSQDDYGTLRTDLGGYNAWRLQTEGLPILFWDIAGEDFELLNDLQTNTRPDDLARLWTFLWQVLPQCDGFFLTLSLPRLWATNEGTGQRLSDREVRNKINTYVRFIDIARIASWRATARNVPVPELHEAQEKIDLYSKRAGQLKVPVVLNLSMADVYSSASMSPNMADENAINPERDDPREVAERHLPQLHNCLRRTVRWYRIDFSQVYSDGEITSEEKPFVPRGVSPMYEFVVKMNWRGGPLSFAAIKAIKLTSEAINRWREKRSS
jgi:hypothetical protein